MNKKLISFLAMGLFAGHGEEKTSIPSHKIKQPEQDIQLSKRQIQKMKGKKARKNRGRNRT